MEEEEEELRKELRRAVLPRLNEHLAKRGLPRLPPEVFEDLISIDPPPPGYDADAWLEDAREPAVRIMRARARSAAQRSASGGRHVDEPLPADDRRWSALAEIRAIEARQNPSVASWRAHHLQHGLLDGEAAASFRNELDLEARRWLEQVAANLVEWHGWWDQDEAALFVLTDIPAEGRRTRTKITVRDRASATRVTIEADPRTSPQAVADSYRRARSHETIDALDLPDSIGKHHRLDGARPHSVTAKNAALALHLARNRSGSWKDRRENWNADIKQTQPAWAYATDAPFARDAARAWAQVIGEAYCHKQSAMHSLV